MIAYLVLTASVILIYIDSKKRALVTWQKGNPQKSTTSSAIFERNMDQFM